ncbi:hypothetical protein [Nocardioides sp.]|uniref:hypothetical protein n=1 Tax=Nocardioides sp. TaxID=35761 RepID=UPI003784CE67
MTALTDPPSPAPAAVAGPQPLGAFGMPAGLLLLPGTDPATESARASLVAGRLPDPWPERLSDLRVVHEDPDDVSGLFPGDDPVDRYNRWVLDPATADAATVRADLPAAYAPLVDVVAYSVGLTDAGALPTTVDDQVAPEVAALLLAAGASARLEAGDAVTASALLADAIDVAETGAPALAAVLRGNHGALLHEHGLDPARAGAELARATADLAGTDLRTTRAELLHLRGVREHERAAEAGEPLQGAMALYYDALQLVTERSAPYLWASVQLDLAAAQLASPMTGASDQLRLGVAAQALRACRRVFDPETTPGPWSTATLNLANALVYLPSTHQGDNLVEAVELYEEVLASGVRDDDPLGRARLLANQGNTLAHLGMFDQARARLVEARFLFEEHLDHDGAMAVRSVLDEIARTQVGDPDDELLDLARQAEQMGRVPVDDGAFTSGMGVRVEPGTGTGTGAAPPAEAQRRAKVTRLSPDEPR